MLFLHSYLICKTQTFSRLKFSATHQALELHYRFLGIFSKQLNVAITYMQLCHSLWQRGSCKVLLQGSSGPILLRGAILEAFDSRALYSCADLGMKKKLIKHN